MSIKFRMDGAVFPTKVENGYLVIDVGIGTIQQDFSFLKEEFEWDNSDFPMSNIMCYLRNSNQTIVMRFDGTVTRYDNNGEVIGFSKFNVDDILHHITIIPVGTILHKYSNGDVAFHTECTIYSWDSAILTGDNRAGCILECVGDPEPIYFWVNENTELVKEIVRGTRYFPRLVKTGTNRYEDDSGKYVVNGHPLKITASVFI